MKKIIFLGLLFLAFPALAQEPPTQAQINSLQARIMAVRAQRDEAMDQLAATKADVSLMQEEMNKLREQIAKLTPKPTDKPQD